VRNSRSSVSDCSKNPSCRFPRKSSIRAAHLIISARCRGDHFAKDASRENHGADRDSRFDIFTIGPKPSATDDAPMDCHNPTITPIMKYQPPPKVEKKARFLLNGARTTAACRDTHGECSAPKLRRSVISWISGTETSDEKAYRRGHPHQGACPQSAVSEVRPVLRVVPLTK